MFYQCCGYLSEIKDILCTRLFIIRIYTKTGCVRSNVRRTTGTTLQYSILEMVVGEHNT